MAVGSKTDKNQAGKMSNHDARSIVSLMQISFLYHEKYVSVNNAIEPRKLATSKMEILLVSLDWNDQVLIKLLISI